MIKATEVRWHAHYHPSQEQHIIVGWNEHDGSPLIVHPTTGVLIPAADFTTADGHALSGVTDETEKRQQRDENFRRGARLFLAWRKNDAEALAALCAEADAHRPRPLSLITGLLHFLDVFLEDIKYVHDIGSETPPTPEQDTPVRSAGDPSAAVDQQLAVIRDDVADLKAGQIEIRDLLARVVARLEGA